MSLLAGLRAADSPVLSLVSSAVVQIAILALALGLVSWRAGFPHRGWAIGGTLIGGALVVLWLITAIGRISSL
jgi:hypothetical protein